MYEATREVPLGYILGTAKFFKRPALLITLVIMTVLVFGNKLILPDTYEAAALVKIKDQSLQSIMSNDDESRTRGEQVDSASANEIVSRSVVTSVVNELGLDQWDTKRSLVDDVTEYFGLARKPINTDLVVRQFQEHIKVISAGSPGQGLFNVTYVDDDPTFASAVVNTTIHSFTNSKRDYKVREANNTIAVLERQIKALDEEIILAKEDIGTFAGSNISNLVPHDQLITTLQDAKKSIIETRTRIYELEAREQGLSTLLSAEPSFLAQTQIAAQGSGDLVLPPDQLLERKRNELVAQEMRFTPTHPDIIRLQKEIATLEQVVTHQPRSGGKTLSTKLANPEHQRLKSELASVQAGVKAGKSQLGELEKLIGDSQKKLTRSHVFDNVIKAQGSMQDKLELNRVNLKAKLINAQIVRNIAQTEFGSEVSIIEDAPENALPKIRSRLILYMAGVGGSLMVGLAVAVGLSYLFLMRLQRTYGAIRHAPSLTKVLFKGYEVDQATGLIRKMYMLTQPLHRKTANSLVLAGTGNGVELDQNEANQLTDTFGVEPRVERFHIGDVCSVELFNRQEGAITTGRWFIPLMFVGFGSIVGFIVLEFLKQNYVLPF